MSSPHVLIVEDEIKIARALADYLEANGFRTTLFAHGAGVVDWVRANAPQAVLLDVTLPLVDGLTLCREIRGFSSVPILMVTARVEEIDRLLGLDAGADDYICKPFSLREVVARIHAVSRRANAVPDDSDGGRVMLDAQRFEVRIGDKAMPVTPVEFRLLKELMSRPGKIFSRPALMTVLYEDHRIVSDRTVDSHVRNLRRKFAEAGISPIDSVYGVGFRFSL